MPEHETYQGRIGKYNVIEVISSEGGFGLVFKVRHIHLGRVCAMKVLRYGLADGDPNAPTLRNSEATVLEKMETYFHQEGRLIASVRHPHIIELYDFDIERGPNKLLGMADTGIKPYFVMPLADGDLASSIARKRFSPEQAISMLEPLAQALDFAFTQTGMVHLDVKPHNALWLEGRLVLSDFGIARLAGEPASKRLGTPPYMAPERILDEEYIPHRSADVFSLGVMAYQMLCGVRPHPYSKFSEYNKLYKKHGYTLPTFHSKGVHVDPEIEAVVRNALAFNARDRYASCTAFVDALQEVITRRARQKAAAQKQQEENQQRRLEERVRELEQLVATLQQAESRAKVAEQQRANLQVQLSNLQREKHQQALAAKQELQRSTNELRVRLAQAQHDIRELETLLNQQRKDVPVQDAQLQELQRRLAQATQRIQALFQEKAALEQQLHTWEELLAAEQNSREKQKLERSMQELQALLSQATTQIRALERQNAALQGKLNEKTAGRQQPAALQRRNSQLLAENQALQEAIAYRDQVLAAYRATVQEKQRLEAHLRNLEQQLRPLANAEERATAAERQLEELRKQLRPLQSTRRNPVILQKTARLLKTHTGFRDEIMSIAWSPDGHYIALGGSDKPVTVYDASIDKQILTGTGHDNTVTVFEALTGKVILTYEGHSHHVGAVAWSPDGRSIASGGYDETVQVFDASTGKALLICSGHTGSVGSVAWSPDGRYIASGGWEPIVQVFDAQTGESVLTYEGHSHHVGAVAWSPDGRYIASGSNDKTVQVFDPFTGNTILTCSGHTGSLWSNVRSVAWSPDGRYIASGSNDKTVQVFDAQTGESVLTYKGHRDTVSSVAWSPDGRYIASGSWDATIHVFDPFTGNTILTCSGYTASRYSVALYSIAWSPDGRYIASASNDKTVQIWLVADS